MKYWKFWIDVGGTFTDCLYLSPESSQLKQQKFLSSSSIKCAHLVKLVDNSICDPAFRCKRDNFFKGFRLLVHDDTGALLATSTVVSSLGESGKIVFEPQDVLSKLEKEQRQAPDSCGNLRAELFSPEPAPLLAIRWATESLLQDELPDVDIRLGTTKGTNALLTRTGAKCALITTAGFKHILEIGDQTRPELFKLDIQKVSPLYDCVIEIDERILCDGEVDAILDREQAKRELERLKSNGIQSLAICLMNGFRFPEHEVLLENIARQLGFHTIVRSSQVAQAILPT